jgi:hypothetical protein
MSYIHPAALAARRKYWTRHDAWRFAAPGTPEAERPGWLDPSATRVRLKEAQEEEARAAFAAEVKALQAQQDRLCEMMAEINYEFAWRKFLRKYSPSQPRVPAGNPDGGQWTSGAGEGVANAETDNDLEQAQGEPLRTARDQASRDDLPQLEALANDAVIRSRIDEAWTVSNPNSARPQEHGFWISRNEATGEVFTRPFANLGSAARITPGPTPTDAIAFFHTHPNRPEFRYRSGPSVGDQGFAADVGLGLIQSHNGMYYFGPPLRPSRRR